jgi:tetratricopeptide (TPR) repeat protein
MRSIGTITMHFPFIDDIMKARIESLMEKASDYSDFVSLLTRETMKNKGDPTLPILAFLHSRNLCYIDGIEALSREFAQLPSVMPFVLNCQACRTQARNWDELQTAIDKALEQGLDDWLIVEMCLLRINAGRDNSQWGPDEENSMDTILRLVQSNRSLSCYIPDICIIQSSRYIDEENREMAIKSAQHGIELAEANDDPVLKLDLYRRLAVAVEESNSRKSVEYLRMANKTLDSLGNSVLEATILSHIGRIMTIRGEFTGALEAYLEAIHIHESFENGLGIIPYCIAQIYNILGDGNEAHKWSKVALYTISDSKRALACTHTQMARALIQLGRPIDARLHLDKARDLSQVVGNEAILALYSIAEGLIDEAETLYDDAYHSYEKGVEIIVRHKYPIELNDCALQLARLEVERFSLGAMDDNDDYSTVWLDGLEQVALEKDYPGILGLALLLKAELHFKQNKHSEAKLLIEEVGNIAQQPGLEYLDDKIANLLSVMDQMIGTE